MTVRRRAVPSIAFIVACVATVAAATASAQEFAGNYRITSDVTTAEVPEWGSDCGQRPENHRGNTGRQVRVSEDGTNLVIEDRPRMRTDGCWSQNPRARPVDGPRSARRPQRTISTRTGPTRPRPSRRGSRCAIARCIAGPCRAARVGPTSVARWCTSASTRRRRRQWTRGSRRRPRRRETQGCGLRAARFRGRGRGSRSSRVEGAPRPALACAFARRWSTPTAALRSTPRARSSRGTSPVATAAILPRAKAAA